MEPRHVCCPLLHLLLLVILLGFHGAGGQAVSNDTVAARFACNVSAPCDTFVVYWTQSPGFLDLGSISDLFGTSRARIASANNMTSEDGVLLPGQPLLVPVRCGCTGGRSFANITYPIQLHDTFYYLAGTAYENLTDFHLIQEMNPGAEATDLQPQQEVTVPLFCRCPTQAERSRGVQSLITYVWQPGDNMSEVSKLMNSNAIDIAAANNVTGNFTSVMGPPMLIPVQQRPQLPPLLHVPSSGDDRTRSRRRGIIIGTSISGSLVALAALCMAILAHRRYRKKALVHSGSRLLSPRLCWSKNQYGLNSSSSYAHMVKGGGKLLTGVSQFIDKPIIFVEEEIMEATMNLDEKCKIGSSYYRAKLDGEVFAVKPAKGDVSAELRMMQMVNHTNLIKLAGMSIGVDGDYAFLVYEFAEKGSLDKWLYQKLPSSLPSSSTVACTLSWEQRLGIALDVANGLLYMHEHTQPSMVHGDIRARNILLTADFRAKISSFSLAKPDMVDAAATSSDVFAFGLLLLELLSGRRAVEARVGTEIGMLWSEIRAVLEAGDKREAKLSKWMDPALGSEYHMDAAVSLAGMARACTEEDAARRPKMAEVVFSLSMLAQPLSVADAFEKPWQPSSEDNIGIADAVAAR
ncbi:serine/threonine receptor-like kinase NFP [Phragmites australis]|uniref:serine/threonine receptor-like kinase NFP n=1 Tax=Phragmites australis TaxID=29695 RepID=UPI002D79FC42|nr:serine/threonine receptor-like kinase NFP [Phragmites australis]